MAGVSDPKIHASYYKAIAETCPYAAEKKIGISVKPHGGTNATGPQCRKLIEGVGRKNFGLWYDPGTSSTTPKARSTRSRTARRSMASSSACRSRTTSTPRK